MIATTCSRRLSSAVLQLQSRNKFLPSTLSRAAQSLSSSSSLYDDDEPSGPLRALVVGSSGALGSAMVSELASQGVQVVGADIVEASSSSDSLHDFVGLPTDANLAALTTALTKGVQDLPLDAIVCANGGFGMDPTFNNNDSDSLLLNAAAAYGQMAEDLHRVNFHPCWAASFVAQHCMRGNSGLVVLVGATAALSPTLGFTAYGATKAATHHLVQTLGVAQNPQQSLQRKSIKKQSRTLRRGQASCTVLGLLPGTLDTPSNRQHMEFDPLTWTQPSDLAEQVGIWLHQPHHLRPHSGSLIKVRQGNQGRAVFELVR